MRKRYQPTPAPAQPDNKKIRISASTIKIKPKVKATSTETSNIQSSFQHLEHGEKPPAPTDVALPSPIPVASDTPFVQLFFDPSIATKLRLNYNMNKELIEKAKPIPANDRYVEISIAFECSSVLLDYLSISFANWVMMGFKMRCAARLIPI